MTSREAVRQSLERTRASGFAVDQQEYAIGTVCVAAPIRAGDLVAAVALSLPARRQHELASLAEPLRYTAERISRAIALPN